MTLDDRNQEVNEALEVRFAQINSALEAHEAKLKAMMVPRNAWVMYESHDDEDEQCNPLGQYQFYIGMIKHGGAWRLCHASHYESYCGWCDDISWKPIVEVTIEERIRASAHIDKLKEAIIQSKEKLVPDVEKAIETLSRSLA